jgi:hypothetical protein
MMRFANTIPAPRRFARASRVLATATLMLAAGHFGPAVAQTATSESKELFRKTVMFTGQFSALPQSNTVYKVPANRNFRITDLILTSYTNAFCDITVGRSYEIRLQPNSTLPLSFHSGPTFGPGETVYIVNTARVPGGGNACMPIYTIMGYTFTVQ